MSSKQVTTIHFSPMKGPTYAEALHYILRTPRDVCGVLDFFAPEEQGRAIGALRELIELGAVVFERRAGLYMLPSKRDVS